jgi:hypothetical protein
MMIEGKSQAWAGNYHGLKPKIRQETSLRDYFFLLRMMGIPAIGVRARGQPAVSWLRSALPTPRPTLR